MGILCIQIIHQCGQRRITFRLDFAIHDVACFLHGKKCFPVITGLFRLEGEASLHDRCVKEDVDDIGHRDAKTGKDTFSLRFDCRFDVHIDCCGLGHGA